MILDGDPRLEQLKHLKRVQMQVKKKPPPDDYLLGIGSTYRKRPPTIEEDQQGDQPDEG